MDNEEVIRFIIRHRGACHISAATWDDLTSIELDVPQLEEILTRGGKGESGFDRFELVGVEILEKVRKPNDI